MPLVDMHGKQRLGKPVVVPLPAAVMQLSYRSHVMAAFTLRKQALHDSIFAQEDEAYAWLASESDAPVRVA